MSQDKIIVSNWKMNLGIREATHLINSLKKIHYKDPKIKNIICPQFLLIPLIKNLLKKSKILLGGQDCHHDNKGAYTGDTSINLLKEFNCEYVIVGHSERRHYHNESDTIVRKKVDLALLENIKPIICIGELLKQRKSKQYPQIIKKQLEICIPDNFNKVIIAYEPVWSIGTGLVPSLKEIEEIYQLTKIYLEKSKKIQDFNFLYGGSVNSKNFNEIMKNTNVNGVLIGGSSIRIDEIKKILTTC